MDKEIKQLIKAHLPVKERLTDFDVFKARKLAMQECKDAEVLKELEKASYSAKDFIA